MLQRLFRPTCQRIHALVQALNRSYLVPEDPSPAVPPLAPNVEPETLRLYEALVEEEWFHPTFRLVLQLHLLGLPTRWLWLPAAEARQSLATAFRRLPNLLGLHPDKQTGPGAQREVGVFQLAVRCRDQLADWLEACLADEATVAPSEPVTDDDPLPLFHD